MKAEETRYKLMTELQAQFSKTGADLLTANTAGKSANALNSANYDKPMMFVPQSTGRLKLVNDDVSTTVKGIGFTNTINSPKVKDLYTQEIYSMKELINSSPENMKTFSYDEKIMKTQLALVKKKEWQDILFSDVDWFKKIDLTTGIKRMFGKF